MDHHLADVGAEGLELALEQLRGDVLAARGLDQVLFAVGDGEEVVLVELADVAGGEPAVGVEHLGSELGLAVVAAHHAAASEQDLSIRLRDLDFGAADGRADRTELAIGGRVDEGGSAGFGEAVALADQDSHGVEELGDVPR